MSQYYQTKEGDMLDAICWRYYGTTANGQAEAILEANRALNLPTYGPTLPSGLVIALPPVAPAPIAKIDLFS